MGADGNQSDFRQSVLDESGFQAVSSGQFHAVIAQVLDLLHDGLEVFGSVFQQVTQAVDLHRHGKMFTHSVVLAF